MQYGQFFILSVADKYVVRATGTERNSPYPGPLETVFITDKDYNSDIYYYSITMAVKPSFGKRPKCLKLNLFPVMDAINLDDNV